MAPHSMHREASLPLQARVAFDGSHSQCPKTCACAIIPLPSHVESAMSPFRITELAATYCQCSLEVAPRWIMSALERYAQSEVSSSYCERRVVIGDVGVEDALGAGSLRYLILACLIAECFGIVLAVGIRKRVSPVLFTSMSGRKHSRCLDTQDAKVAKAAESMLREEGAP